MLVVTGAAGFLGRAVARAALAGHSVRHLRLVDRVPAPCDDPRCQIVVADLSDRAAARGVVEGATQVVHLAAIPGGQAEEDPALSRRVNLDATLQLLQALEPSPTRPSGELAEIAPALEAIRKAKGALKFELLEKVSTAARAGDSQSRVNGAQANMGVQASLRTAGDQQMIAADMQLGVNGFGWNSSLRAQSEMRPGELLVVGQSALGTQMNAPPTNKQLYYIVRATL